MEGNAVSVTEVAHSSSAQSYVPQAAKSDMSQELAEAVELMVTDEMSYVESDIPGAFEQSVIANDVSSPVIVSGNRVRIDENRIETEKPYSIKYGKHTFVIRKALDNKIHVYKLS